MHEVVDGSGQDTGEKETASRLVRHVRQIEASPKQGIHSHGHISSMCPVVIRVLRQIACLNPLQVLRHDVWLDVHRTQDVMRTKNPQAYGGERPPIRAGF